MNTSREQALRDIKQFLSAYETLPRAGSIQQKLSLRIIFMNRQGGNKSALKSELKEAIAKPEFKVGDKNGFFKGFIWWIGRIGRIEKTAKAF